MIPRTLEAELKSAFQHYPVVTLTGPRQSGKTTICQKCFPDLPYFNLEFPDVRTIAQDDPRGFLSQCEDGAIIDEIQRVPELTSYIQGIVDEKKKNSLFVLTGSEQLMVSQTVSQSLAGRTAVLRLLPFSLEELYEYRENSSIRDFVHSGFLPRIFDQQIPPNRAIGDYIETYVERDLRSISNVKNLDLFRKFVRLCAGRIGQLLNLNSLANDVGISQPTAREWISLLEASYIIFKLEPFHRNIGKRLIKSPKLYFYDVGLARFLIGIESPDQLITHPLRGPLFENLVIGEALKMRYHRGLANNLMFYRDSNGNEVDLLASRGDGFIGLEIKAGETLNKSYVKGFKNLDAAIPGALLKQIVVYNGESRKAYDTSFISAFELVKELTL